MTIDKIIPWVISFASFAFAVWTASKKDTKENVATIASLMAKLESISNDIKEIVQDNKDLRSIVYAMQNEIAVLKTEVKELKSNERERHA